MGTKIGELATGIWSAAKSGYKDYAGKGSAYARAAGGGYAGDMASGMLKGSGGTKRWGTAGGAALGMGYGAFSDNGSVVGSGVGGAVMGGMAGGLGKGLSSAASRFLRRNPQG